METEKFNRLSDISLRMHIFSSDGVEIDPMQAWLRIHLQSGGRKFVATNNPYGKNESCHVEGNALVVDIPAKRLGTGVLEYMIEHREESVHYADGFRNTYPAEWIKTNKEIV